MSGFQNRFATTFRRNRGKPAPKGNGNVRVVKVLCLSEGWSARDFRTRLAFRSNSNYPRGSEGFPLDQVSGGD